MGAEQPDDTDANIEMWKIKKLIKGLTEARGAGTSMISLVIPVFTLLFFNRMHSAKGPDLTDIKDVDG
jgi:hypothetical protein